MVEDGELLGVEFYLNVVGYKVYLQFVGNPAFEFYLNVVGYKVPYDFCIYFQVIVLFERSGI